MIHLRSYFYPRSPCGERPRKSPLMCSIRHFYPRSPCGERLSRKAAMGKPTLISIHALLAESDGIKGYHSKGLQIFLSTLSLRRATALRSPRIALIVGFLSTLSLRRATFDRDQQDGHRPDFYPRSPCGERQLTRAQRNAGMSISIHALLAESDCGPYCL